MDSSLNTDLENSSKVEIDAREEKKGASETEESQEKVTDPEDETESKVEIDAREEEKGEIETEESQEKITDPEDETETGLEKVPDEDLELMTKFLKSKSYDNFLCAMILMNLYEELKTVNVQFPECEKTKKLTDEFRIRLVNMEETIGEFSSQIITVTTHILKFVEGERDTNDISTILDEIKLEEKWNSLSNEEREQHIRLLKMKNVYEYVTDNLKRTPEELMDLLTKAIDEKKGPEEIIKIFMECEDKTWLIPPPFFVRFLVKFFYRECFLHLSKYHHLVLLSRFGMH